MTLKAHATDINGQPADTMVWTMTKSEYEASPLRGTALRAFDFAGRRIEL
jgi:hypothetical protein